MVHPNKIQKDQQAEKKKRNRQNDFVIELLPTIRRIVLLAHISHKRGKHKDPLIDIKNYRNLLTKPL